jgi:hypothetical protein
LVVSLHEELKNTTKYFQKYKLILAGGKNFKCQLPTFDLPSSALSSLSLQEAPCSLPLRQLCALFLSRPAALTPKGQSA